MPSKLKKLGKEFAKQFAISFFFCCFIFVILYFLFAGKVTKYISLISASTYKNESIEIKPIKFDISKKALTRYPKFKELWATLKIAEIDLELPVYHDDTLDILKNGVGHYIGSYFPGEGGSIVLAAHNNKGFFRRLPELVEGSEIVIEATYGTFTYKLIRTDIINYKDTSKLPIQSNEELLMLYTCYPITAVGLTTERYVVYARLVGEVYES